MSEVDELGMTLESFVDGRPGIDGVLEALASICYGKAEHLRANWQDTRTARAWEVLARKIGRIYPTGF